MSADGSPMQFRPLEARSNPERQSQVKEVSVLIQKTSQSCVPSSHWLIAVETKHTVEPLIIPRIKTPLYKGHFLQSGANALFHFRHLGSGICIWLQLPSVSFIFKDVRVLFTLYGTYVCR